MFILDSLLIGSLRFVLDKVVAGGRGRDAGRLGAARSAARGADAPRARRDHRRRVRRDRARRPRRHPRDQGPAAGPDLDVARGQDQPASTSRASKRSEARLDSSLPRSSFSTAAKAASARRRARRRGLSPKPAAPARRVLVVSTDPAHSLGDALGVALSAHARGGFARRSHAVELDAPRAFARWLKEHRRPLGEILEHGTWLDREDVDALLDLSIPGDRRARRRCSRSRASRMDAGRSASYDLDRRRHRADRPHAAAAGGAGDGRGGRRACSTRCSRSIA